LTLGKTNAGRRGTNSGGQKEKAFPFVQRKKRKGTAGPCKERGEKTENLHHGREKERGKSTTRGERGGKRKAFILTRRKGGRRPQRRPLIGLR